MFGTTVSRRKWAAMLLAGWGMLFAAGASAQEVKKEWRSNAESLARTTERQSQIDLEVRYANFVQYGPFSFEIRGEIATPKKTIYRYGVKPASIIQTPWLYKWGQNTYTSEDALEQAIKASAPTDSHCPPPMLAAIGPWTGIPAGGAGAGADGQDTGQQRDYQTTGYLYDGVNGCQTFVEGKYSQRTRQIKCPNAALMEWSAGLSACVIQPLRETAFAPYLYYWSSPQAKMCDGGGDPSAPGGCNPITGDKSESETDLNLGWIDFGRTYHSFTSTAGGAFGPAWTHSHNIRLAMGLDQTDNPSNTTLSMGLIEADGKQLAFQAVVGGYEAVDGSGDRIVQNGTAWTLYRSDRVLDFDADGSLMQQRYEDGTSLSYAYDIRRRLTSITHSNGRKLELGYGSSLDNTEIQTLSVAGATLVNYGYNANKQVATATYVGGTARTYHYESTGFPLNLTGITAEDNQRLATFEYDTKGRVVTSKLAGDAEKWTVGYTATGGALVTNPLGQQMDYSPAAASPNGLPNKIGETSDTTEGTGEITRTYYDESQDFRRRLSSITDRNDVQTLFTYGQVTDEVTSAAASVWTKQQAVGEPATRTIEERRDLASNRPILTKVGNRETRIVRNARLQPTSVIVKDADSGLTRTTGYTYCEALDVSAANSTCPTLGLLRIVDGARLDNDAIDRTTYAYYGSDDSGCSEGPSLCLHRKGDLWKVTNAAGRVIEVLKYDAMGRPLSVKDANGIITDSEYNGRGWRTAVKQRGTDNAVETDDLITRMEYTPFGSVSKLIRPDGVSYTYTYDSAQRLVKVTDAANFYTQYTLDGYGSRWKDEIDFGTTTQTTYMTRERGFDHLVDKRRTRTTTRLTTPTTTMAT